MSALQRYGRRCALCCLVIALAGGLLGCGEDVAPPDPDALAGFRVTIIDDTALGGAPYAFQSSFSTIRIRIEATRADGSVKTDYNGTVQLRVVPGQVADDSRFVRLIDGVNNAHDVSFRYSFGDARFWAEEVGLDQVNECSDGVDNDGNGLRDFPGDRGCFGPEDPSEGSASYVTGLSEPLLFDAILIRDVQFNPDDLSGDSPLLGEEVVVEGGSMVVTNVTFDGLFVGDVAGDLAYSGIFLFNFNFPEGVIVGDRLLRISGGVNEFQGMSQLTFPDWVVDPDYTVLDSDRIEMSTCMPLTNPDVIELPIDTLTPAALTDLELLETYEGRVVRIENGQVNGRFVNCDFDESGNVSGSSEEACRNDCQDNLLCTELSSFLSRDQFGVNMQGVRVWVSGAKQVANFDALSGCELVEEFPETYQCPERQLISATGNLRHVFLTNQVQLWVLYPRFSCDLRFTCDDEAPCWVGFECVEGICQ